MAETQNSRDRIGIRINPTGWHFEQRGDLVSFKETVKTSEPLLDRLATETEVAAQPFKPRDLEGMSAHPMQLHYKGVSEFSVGKKCWKSQDRRLGGLCLWLRQELPPYEVAGSGRHS